MIKSILGGKSKNLFDINKANVVIHNDGSFSSNVTHTSNFFKLSVKSGQTYTVSCDTTSIRGTGIELQLSCQTGTKYNEGTQLVMFLTSKEMVKDWVHITKTFTIPDNTTQITFSTILNKYFRNFQIELGSTATEYVPHELTSYKSIMKVSDVCQLVDKNKIPTTRTISGVTFTNNGDGSVTVNGTSTHQYYSEIVIPIDGSLFIPGHVYLNGTIAGDFAGFVALYGPVAGDYLMYAQQIYTLPSGKDFNRFRYIIRVRTGVTANDYKCTPQPFDLTKMFGAGNEPKTVAEFKAKFPNDYYPYSPSCFVTSFDERMPCKTKNLFDINANSEKGYYDEQGNFYPNPRFLCYTIDVLSNNTYCISTSKLGSVKGIVSFWNNNTFVSSVNYGEQTAFAYTVPSGANKLKFVIEDNQKYSNIQIEKGTTATDYIPYNYV